jgi:hypothetical protein
MPHIAVNDASIHYVSACVVTDRCVPTCKITDQTGIFTLSVEAIIHEHLVFENISFVGHNLKLSCGCI